jgi:hypothetical protein
MSIRGRMMDVGLGGLAAAQLGAAVWLRPSGSTITLADGRPLGGMCLSHELFGVDCPFCGLTRSFVALAHGDLHASLAWHPAGPILFVAMIMLVAAVLVVGVRRTQPLVERKRFLFAFQSVALLCLAIGVFKLVRS